MERSLLHSTVSRVKTTEKAVVLQQATGRSCSRKAVNGKSHPQLTFMIYLDTEQNNLTETLKPWFPLATWEEYQPVYAAQQMVGSG